jgi:hypothetical protein
MFYYSFKKKLYFIIIIIIIIIDIHKEILWHFYATTYHFLDAIDSLGHFQQECYFNQ